MNDSVDKRAEALSALEEAYARLSVAWTPRQDFLSKRRFVMLLSIALLVASLNKAMPTAIAVIGVSDLDAYYMWLLLAVAFGYSVLVYLISAVGEWRRAKAAEVLVAEFNERLETIRGDASAVRTSSGGVLEESRYHAFFVEQAYASGNTKNGRVELERLAAVAADIRVFSRTDRWLRAVTFLLPLMVALISLLVTLYVGAYDDRWPPTRQPAELKSAS